MTIDQQGQVITMAVGALIYQNLTTLETIGSMEEEIQGVEEGDFQEVVQEETIMGLEEHRRIEIIAVVLSSAYVAQITRRLHREEIMWYAVNERNKEFEEYDSLQRPHNELSSCNDTEV